MTCEEGKRFVDGICRLLMHRQNVDRSLRASLIDLKEITVIEQELLKRQNNIKGMCVSVLWYHIKFGNFIR